MTSEKSLGRKGFLKIGTRFLLWVAGALGLGILTRYFSHLPDQGPPSSFDLGPISGLPDERQTIYPEIPAVLFRKGASFRAMSLRCTHLGCTLEKEGDLFSCPCHGSVFLNDGTVDNGPALEDLPELRIEISEEGHLTIYAEGGGR
jgi:Rieske Fe-S protein